MLSYKPFIKRCLDVVLSFMALICFSPLCLLISLAICLESKGSPFFIQERIGKGMRPFRLIKFRSMTMHTHPTHTQFEPGKQSRITRVGAFLRATKLDELPELFNILKGDMSIVGPRPEVPKYVECYPDEFQAILQVRPGLSDYASIEYRHEEYLLANASEPEEHYVHVILPDKLRLAQQYVENISLVTDFTIMFKTVTAIKDVNPR